eukprot:636659-Pyramimonas_sp.AAC.1
MCIRDRPSTAPCGASGSASGCTLRFAPAPAKENVRTDGNDATIRTQGPRKAMPTLFERARRRARMQ